MADGVAKQMAQCHLAFASAGLVRSAVDPLTVEVIAEIGIDITDQVSQSLTEFKAAEFDAVISLCGCGVNLPDDWVTHEIFQDWQLDDPAGATLETFRKIRDQVKVRVADLLTHETLMGS